MVDPSLIPFYEEFTTPYTGYFDWYAFEFKDKIRIVRHREFAYKPMDNNAYMLNIKSIFNKYIKIDGIQYKRNFFSREKTYELVILHWNMNNNFTRYIEYMTINNELKETPFKIVVLYPMGWKEINFYDLNEGDIFKAFNKEDDSPLIDEFGFKEFIVRKASENEEGLHIDYFPIIISNNGEVKMKNKKGFTKIKLWTKAKGT